MKKSSQIVALLFLGIALGAPLGASLVQRLFIEKEKALGLLGEEAFIDDFAKTQFIHADPISAHAALIHAVEIHKEMQAANPQYRGRPENVDLAWCYAELSILEESDGNAGIAKSDLSEAARILRESGAKDTSVTHLVEALRDAQAQDRQDAASSGTEK